MARVWPLRVAIAASLLAIVSASGGVTLDSTRIPKRLDATLGESLGLSESEAGGAESFNSSNSTFIPCGMPEDQFDWNLATMPPVCRNLFTPNGKVVNMANWLAVCTKAGRKQAVGLKIQMNGLTGMNEAAKQFTFDVRIEFAWYDPVLRDFSKLKQMGIDYEKMMWNPFDSFWISNEVEYKDYPTGAIGVEKYPKVNGHTGLAMAIRNRRYTVLNKAWNMRHYPFDKRTLEIDWYLGHRQYVHEYPVSAFTPGALTDNGWEKPQQHPALVANGGRRLLSKFCEIETDAYELSLKPDLRFTDTMVVRNQTHITNRMVKKFSTPWAGFDLKVSDTIFYTGDSYPFPACETETCAKTSIEASRMATPVLASSVTLLLLCVCMAYATWYIDIKAMMPRVALCVIAFLAACTIANTVSKKLPTRSEMCFVEWIFVYNFLLLACCVFLHAASHYMDVNVSAKRSDAMDYTMRISMPFIHAGSYFFAWGLAFNDQPVAEILGVGEFILAVFATFVVWKRQEKAAKKLEDEEQPMKPASQADDIEKNVIADPPTVFASPTKDDQDAGETEPLTKKATEDY